MKKLNCIMLVDDNPADNLYHKIQIEKASVCNHIITALDGEQALVYLKKSEKQNQIGSFPVPDIIFLDINMPKMNGWEFLVEYEKLDDKIKSKIIIIMLTTSLNPDDRKSAHTIKEVAEFQNKPMTVEIIQETIKKYF